MIDASSPHDAAQREPHPRALVLGGGGARAAYEVGILSAIAERAPTLEFPIITGESAGAINATFLAAHQGSFAEAVGALRANWLQLVADRVYRIRPLRVGPAILRALVAGALGRRTDPATVRGLVDLEPLREFLKRSINFSGIDAKIASGRLRAIALSATSYGSGEVVTFVHGGPDAPTWRRALRRAVRRPSRSITSWRRARSPCCSQRSGLRARSTATAACARPRRSHPPSTWALAAFWSSRNRATRAQAMTHAKQRDYPTFAEVVGLLLHSVFLDALEADVEQIERVNRMLAQWPAGPAPDGLRPISLLVLRPSRNLGALARGTGAALPSLLRWGVRMMGGERAAGADFLSYLVFDPTYTNTLIELGYEDGQAAWDRIEPFLEATTS